MKKLINILLIIIVFVSVDSYGQRRISLDESIQYAIENNAAGKNSRLEIEAAKEIRKSAFTNYFPSISGSWIQFKANENMMEMETAGGNLPVYDGNPANLLNPTQFAYMPASKIGLMKTGAFGFLNIVQPVFAGGRIFTGNKLAGLGEEVAVLKNKMTIDELKLKTEEMYRQIIMLDEKKVTIDKYESLLKSLLGKVEDAYKSGIAMKNDVLKVKLKLSEVELNKSKIENGRNLAMLAFCQFIGIEYDSSIKLTDELSVKTLPEIVFTDKKESVKNRTEYSLLQKSVDAEKLKTDMKIGEFLPEAGIGYSGNYMKMDKSDSKTFGMVFGTVSVPISKWWSGSYELEERSIREAIAENTMKENCELIELEIEKTWQDLTTSYKQYLLSVEAKEQAEENLKVNEDGYKNGIIDVSDLLEAQAMLQDCNDRNTEAKSNYLNMISRYLKATGRL